MNQPTWWNKAACAGASTELFFPVTGEKTKMKKAKAFCKGCTVTVECLQDTLKAEDPAARYGVFGGLSAAERKLLFGSAPREELPPSELSA